jgi:hypothetical protein
MLTYAANVCRRMLTYANKDGAGEKQGEGARGRQANRMLTYGILTNADACCVRLLTYDGTGEEQGEGARGRQTKRMLTYADVC